MKAAQSFHGVLLDTNVLRASGFDLRASWIEDLCEKADLLNVPILVVEASVSEWGMNLLATAVEKQSQVASSLSFLGMLTGTDLQPPVVSGLDRTLAESHIRKMVRSMGFVLVPNAPGPLHEYIEDAISKVPPFESGGKGFVDAVILDSAVSYLLERDCNPHLLIVSNDNAFVACARRLARKRVRATVTRKENLKSILEGALSEADAAFVQGREAALVRTAREHEAEAVRRAESIGFHFGGFSSLMWSNDDELRSAMPERIIRARAIGIDSAYALLGVPEEIAGKNRYRVVISVAFDVDIVFTRYLQQSALGSYATNLTPANIDSMGGIDVRPPLMETPQVSFERTVQLTASVDGSIDRAAYDAGQCVDFRFEDEFTPSQLERLIFGSFARRS